MTCKFKQVLKKFSLKSDPKRKQNGNPLSIK